MLSSTASKHGKRDDPGTHTRKGSEPHPDVNPHPIKQPPPGNPNPGGGMVSSRTGLTPHLRFRRAVLSRDRRAGITNCPINGCGVELDYDISRQPNSAEPDHIIPDARARELGWTIAQLNAPSNGRTICRRCNQRIGAKGDPKPTIKTAIQASPGW